MSKADRASAARELGIRLEPPKEPHKPEYVRFFNFAKANCCNYSAAGPWGKRHYCWLEPQETNSFCVLPWGRYCQWFTEAVLPLNPELELAWHRLRGTAKADHKAKAERECVDCGRAFVAASRRQFRCPKCSDNRRRTMARNRKRRQRGKEG